MNKERERESALKQTKPENPSAALFMAAFYITLCHLWGVFLKCFIFYLFLFFTETGFGFGWQGGAVVTVTARMSWV